nr:polymorphic toxin type 15 domain-containing protein [uncultured Pseudomonas sp.]
MYLDYLVPSWLEIESRITDEMGYQGGAQFRTYLNEPVASLALNLRRVRAVQSAFNQAEWQAAGMLRQRFAELEIASILNELLMVVRDMAMIVVGSTLTGGAIGAGIGAFGAGAGAIPLAGAGAAMGLKVSGWILGALGLASIAEFFIEGLPRIGEYYIDGISIAWEGTRDESLNPFGRDDPHAVSRAAHHIALGHVEVVVLLLGAIVSYLTRGRGDARVLAHEMAASRKGARLAQWMLKHEEGLKKRPDLQVPERRKGAMNDAQPQQPNRPTGKDKEPSKDKPSSMPLHTVACFKADKLPGSKHGEFERQLRGQQDGLNRLTVEEFLENVANPVKRDPRVARRARMKLQRELQARLQSELSKVMPALEAEKIAIQQTKETMASLAALHNPDLIAGGKDVISGFGDKQVNSTIGPQWKSKINDLTSAAKKVPKPASESTLMNVKLHKC